MTKVQTQEGPHPAHVHRFLDKAERLCPSRFWFFEEVAQRMAERLAYIRVTPSLWLDSGCGRGDDMHTLSRLYQKAMGVGLDWRVCESVRAFGTQQKPWYAPFLPAKTPSASLHFVQAKAPQWPLASGQADLIWSNLLLPFLPEPDAFFAEALRVLKPGGLLLFSTLGPDSFEEWRAVKSRLNLGGAGLPSPFADMHDLGDALVRSGFSDPVMDMERLTLTYPDLPSMLRELRQAGALEARPGAFSGFLGQSTWARLNAAYPKDVHTGRPRLTLELLQGHAWKPAATPTPEVKPIHFHPKQTPGGHDSLQG